jgi:nucleotide-binding universal stress UspA family protein
MTTRPARPVVIGFDGSHMSEHAVREAAALFAPRPALVVMVWEAGRAFEAATTPALEAPPVTLEIPAALAADQDAADSAGRTAQHGVSLARDLGLDATGLAVADEGTVADTLIRLAGERDAQAIVLGTHGRGGLVRRLLGSTSQDVLRRAPCAVVLVRDGDGDDRARTTGGDG